METRANTVLVGVFTLLVVLVGFGFVYWVARVGDDGDMVPLRIRIAGSVSGLGVGSEVFFNGIKVGKVRAVDFDREDPRLVYAEAEVKPETPLREDSTATIGTQGLTGQSYISLKGGTPEAPRLLREGGRGEITAAPSAVTDILETVRDVATRVDKTFASVEGFVNENRGPLSRTVSNIESFSQSLSRNAEGIDKFLAAVSSTASSLEKVSTKLDATITGAEKIVTAVDPQAVREAIENVRGFTGEVRDASRSLTAMAGDLKTFTSGLGTTGEGINEVVASARETAENLKGISSKLDGTIDGATAVIAAIDPATVKQAVTDFRDTAASAKSTLAQADSVTQAFASRREEIGSFLKDASELAAKLNSASGRVEGVLVRMDGVLGSLPADRIARIVEDFEATAKGARQTVAQAGIVTEAIAGRREDIDGFITDARTLAAQLKEASTRVDGVMAKVDGFLGSTDGPGLSAEIKATLAEFRVTAQVLRGRVDTISADISKFSGKGLEEVRALVQETRRSINRIDQTVADFDKNPQRLIFGGEKVREYDGARPRR